MIQPTGEGGRHVKGDRLLFDGNKFPKAEKAATFWAIAGALGCRRASDFMHISQIRQRDPSIGNVAIARGMMT